MHKNWCISTGTSAASSYQQHQHMSSISTSVQCISAAAHPQYQHISSIRASTVSPHRQHQQHQCIRSLSSISESVALAYRTRINTKTMTKHDMACELVLNCWPFRQLSTWLHDNHCDLTIKSHTGQHSQFLQCLLRYIHHIPDILQLPPPFSPLVGNRYLQGYRKLFVSNAQIQNIQM